MLKWLLLLCCALPATAQQVPVKITAVFDSTAVAELYNTCAIGLEMKYADSSVRKTTGLLKGNVRWSDIKVESPYGEVSNGILRFNRNAIRPNNYRMLLLVTPAGGKQQEVYLQLPYLSSIRINNYTDSLKRGIHFYVNVEGIFNTGRIYPLDTARVRISSDAGQLIGQDLLIPVADSVTKRIAVKAVYRGNSSLTASSVIPVKQLPDDESLIIQNEKDVFKKPSKKQKKQ